MRSVVVVVSLLLVAVGLLWLSQRRLIYFPSQDVLDVDVALPGAEEVSFRTEDDLILEGWFLPGTTSATTVVVFSGNAGNRGDRGKLGRALADHGYAVLLFDYRGYGGNPGRPTEEGLISDGKAAVQYLDERADVDGEGIVYFGESLGAGVALGISEIRPPVALILRSPFTSLGDVGVEHYPFLPIRLLLWDDYPNLDVIKGVGVPILVVAGSADRTVPVGQSMRLYDAAHQPKELVIIDGADHNDRRLSSGAELVDHVVDFIDRVVSR